MVQATVNLQVRLPEALRRKLAEEAETNKRSLNSEVVWRLEQSFARQELPSSGVDADHIADRMLNSPEFRQRLAAMISTSPLGSRRKAKKE
jgi:Arc-like DNA binding domain